MSLRYGMRLGRGLGVSGGGGILIIHLLFWVLQFSVVSIIRIGFYVAYLCGWVIQSSVKEKESRKKHQSDVALAHRIAAQRVQHVKYLPAGRTNPPALWGVYLIQPSCGQSYAKCGRHPSTLRKLWLENRKGAVHELLVLSDKAMGEAATELLKSGVISVKPDAVSIVCGFTANGMPVLQSVQPE